MTSTRSTLQHRVTIAPESALAGLSLLFGSLVVLFAALVTLSAPGLAVTVSVVTLVGTVTVQRALAALVQQHGDEVRELTVPGVGTVRFRIRPQ